MAGFLHAAVLFRLHLSETVITDETTCCPVPLSGLLHDFIVGELTMFVN